MTQLARALGAKHAISSTTNHAKVNWRRHSDSMRSLIPPSRSSAHGVRRITGGYGADIVIDGIGGEVLSEALGVLALEEVLQHWGIPQAVRQPLT